MVERNRRCRKNRLAEVGTGHGFHKKVGRFCLKATHKSSLLFSFLKSHSACDVLDDILSLSSPHKLPYELSFKEPLLNPNQALISPPLHVVLEQAPLPSPTLSIQTPEPFILMDNSLFFLPVCSPCQIIIHILEKARENDLDHWER